MWSTLFLLAAPGFLSPNLDGPPTPELPEVRRPWDDSKVVGSPEPPTPFKTVRAFPKLTLKQPLLLMPEPGTNRLFALEHLNYWAGPGRLVAFADDQGATEAKTLLDIDGLAVGLAFHPDYAKNGQIFIGLNGRSDTGGRSKATMVARYTVDRANPDRIDPATRKVIIEWPSNGHDGGDLAFGNDGFLYVSSGDGSSDSDANQTGQDITDLQGSVLRIDVDHPSGGKPYSVPTDNPFVGRAGARPELWCYGLRNPWRLSVDRETGNVWVGNNGQDLWEQVYLIKKGANFGWSIAEGSHPFRHQRTAGPDPVSPPAAEHSHGEARSLTGGRVYRGSRLPELVGAYVYGDWSTGRVWGLKHDGEKATWHKLLVDTSFSITGFGTDHAGELYVIDEVSGFHRLEPTTEADRPATPFPTRLSQTGVFAPTKPPSLNSAALPYEVVAPHWADGATSAHAIAIPGLAKIEQKSQRNAGGAWLFPEGTVLAQTLSLDVVGPNGKAAPTRIETRLLARQQGEWIGYSYRWNDDQTDAELVGDSGDGEDFEVPDPAAPGGHRPQAWRFPSRAECMACHSRALGFVMGFTPKQLDKTVKQAGHDADQLAVLERLGLFEGPLPSRKPDRTRLVDPYDASAPLEARARSYLDVNCSTCHVKEGGGNARLELGLGNSLRGMNLVDERPVHADLGLPDARLVAPGSPERSVLYRRVSSRGGGQMPPLVSSEVDRRAVQMLGEWIKGLKAEKP
jgi:uncharacterized repeat protein (TIGR03806 family)